MNNVDIINKQSLSSEERMSCESIKTSKSIEDMSAEELRDFIKNSLGKKV